MSSHGRLSLLVAQRAEVTICQVNTVKPGRARQRLPALQNLIGSSTSGCATSRGYCFSRNYLDRPTGWGARLAGGVVHSQAVATVACWQQPGRADGEGWPPHAVKGLGDDESPGSQPSGKSRRQRAKLQPAPPERGEKMLEECGP